MVLSFFTNPTLFKALKWALMSSPLFWAIVFRLSSADARLPQFVYANF